MKKLTALLCTLFLALSLTACGGGKDKEVSVDPAKLADELLATVSTDQLSETASEMVPAIYLLEEDAVESSIAYASSGATACEIAVIQSKDADSTADVEKKLQKRVDDQSALYSTYAEEQVGKLDKAIIKSAGVYTVLCVTDDVDKANEILKGYGF